MMSKLIFPLILTFYFPVQMVGKFVTRLLHFG